MNAVMETGLPACTGNVTGSGFKVFEPFEFQQRVLNWVACLLKVGQSRGPIGLMIDNSPDWIAIDRASSMTGRALVPIPGFFTNDQVRHLLVKAGVDLLVTDQAPRFASFGFEREPIATPTPELVFLKTGIEPANLPKTIQKITFTSGTTGQPKGVCLSLTHQLQVAQALVDASAGLDLSRHLCLLPFAVLLENIAGVLAPMLAGADIVCPSLAETGLVGATRFDAQQCLATIQAHQAQSIVLLPQMLHAILRVCKAGDSRLSSLKFVAVGGGKVPLALLNLAKSIGLPVYEGYGLTECGSVVCLNTPANHRLGSVGKPLPGVAVRIEKDQEIWVKGRVFEGYLNDVQADLGNTVQREGWLPTGDLGEIDSEGFVFILGRKKNLIVTSFGRNVSPEWPESLLMATGLFLQVAVYGEGMPNLCAVLVTHSDLKDDTLWDAIQRVNSDLPDYAQIKAYTVASEPFSISNQLATANGRVLRDAVWSCYGHTIQFNRE